ncbi:MAG: Pyruvate kinase [Chlamydiia bacterium]|nr:Pyruvate kinase [Chlamydiia bacterium]
MQHYMRTKVICTIGPAVGTYEKIKDLMKAGMNVARLNFSHGDHDQHAKTIALLKKARDEMERPLAIMLDTKGPEIRVGKIKDDNLVLEKGQKLKLLKSAKEGDAEGIPISPPSVIDDITKGMTILFDDGYISSKTIEKGDGYVIVKIDNSGNLKSNKGVNIPHGEIQLPSMTEQDTSDLQFGCEQDVDIIAASFIRLADNVLEIRKLIKKHTKSDIMIISKIESVMGVKNFESILQVSDGIMVARGDLGVELPLNHVPRLQKMMIAKCNKEGKPAVIATQMLESMINHPRPTRAEVSDVANAIYDSASCVMLSGETAIGKYPIASARMMSSIIEEAEKDFEYRKFFRSFDFSSKDISTSVAVATVKTAYSSDAQAIFTYTSSGFTARLISRLRPKIPIISLTSSKKTFDQLSFLWGVVPVYHEYNTREEAFNLATCFALSNHYVHYGDTVLVTSGTPFGIRGTTNMMIVKSIGKVAARGKPSRGKQVYGEAIFVLTHEKEYETKGKIVILTHCQAEYEDHLKSCIGIILQNHRDDSASEESALEISKKYDISIVVQAESARSLIQEGEMVTLDPSKGLVFEGEISSEEEVLKEVCSSINKSECQ